MSHVRDTGVPAAARVGVGVGVGVAADVGAALSVAVVGVAVGEEEGAELAAVHPARARSVSAPPARARPARTLRPRMNEGEGERGTG